MDEPSNTAKWLGLLLLLGSVPLILIVAPLLMSELLTEPTLVPTLVYGGHLASTCMLSAGAVGLFRRRRWARGVTMVGGALGLLVVTYLVSQTTWWLGFAALPHVIALLVLTMPAFDVAPGYDEVRAPGLRRRYALIGTLFIGLALTITLAEDEIRELAWDIRDERWESKCEATGQREVCGRWALRQIYAKQDFASVVEGLAMLDKLCARDKVHLACEAAARLRSHDDHKGWGLGTERWFRQERARRAATACDRGDSRGCLVAAGGAVDEGTPPAQSCEDGDFARCANHVDPMAQALAAIESRANNPGLHTVSVKAVGEEQACEQGSAPACFLMGLNGTADVNPFADDPVGVRSLEVTMGRGCELGLDVACYVFALRLLDRTAPPTEHQQRAVELLDDACERSHVASCWLRAMLRPDPAVAIDEYAEAAETACSHAGNKGPSCVATMHARAFQVGAEPFLIADSSAYARMRWACLNAGDRNSCVAGAELMLRVGRSSLPGTPPLLVQGARLAEKACRGRSAEGCRLLFEYASFQHAYGLTQQKALRDKICPQVPGACEDRQVSERK